MAVAIARPRTRTTRVQSTFKIDPAVKKHVDLLAEAFGKEKSQIVEEAVRQYLAKYESQLRALLQAQEEIQRLASKSDAEVFGVRGRPRGYRGGPVSGKERAAST